MCPTCNAGKYAADQFGDPIDEGAVYCTNCSSGHYSTHASSICSVCGGGHYSLEGQADACEDCLPGNIYISLSLKHKILTSHHPFR